jgi:hypothetical protein
MFVILMEAFNMKTKNNFKMRIILNEGQKEFLLIPNKVDC